jgi:gliding motility-associatede transport system auxiliary component
MKPISRRLYALASVALIVVLFVAVNIVSSVWLRSARIDLTQNGLYSVSAGTRATVSKLQEPITLRLYYSRAPASGYASIVAYAGRVRDLLQEYAALSGGKLIVEEIDPAPFTPAEDEAVQAGMTGAPTQEGENVYFGLVGTNTLNGHEAIPFFDQNREQYLEYDLTSLIYKLSQPQKPKLAVMSSLPLAQGSGGLAAALSGNQMPFAIYQQLQQTYDLQTLETTVDRIPADISTLLLIHPSGLTDTTMYAVDQFVLRGGHAIVFVDPFSELSGTQSPGQIATDDKTSSDLKPLFAAWGVDYDPSKVVVDAELGQQVQFGGRVVDYIAWLRMQPDNFNMNDPAVGNLQLLNVATPGALKPHQGATTKFVPLITTSQNAMQMDSIQIRVTQNPQDLIRRFQAQGKFDIAARISGPVKTAYPNGAPAVAPAQPPAPGADAPKPPTTPLPAQIKDANDINVIVVADSDLVDDKFWVQIQNMLGQRVAIPTADNGAMVVNFVENMMGSNDLISLRTRERTARPFTVVEQIRRDAEGRFLAQEQALQQKVTTTQQNLRTLQGQGGPEGETKAGTPVITKEQQVQIDKLRRDLVESRTSLRQVQANLRRDVENLGNLLAFLNIAFVPLVLTAAAGGVAYARNRRRARAKGM